jgi:hypothetical protein
MTQRVDCARAFPEGVKAMRVMEVAFGRRSATIQMVDPFTEIGVAFRVRQPKG